MPYKHLTIPQELALATETVVGNHKHWAKVKIDPKTGTATVRSKTGRVAKVTKTGRVLKGAL